MKKIILHVLFSSMVLPLFAQKVEMPGIKPSSQELGIFGQTGTGNSSDNQSMTLAGLQYKHWHNEHLGYRFIAAFGQYSSSGGKVEYISGDTSVTKQEHFNISLPVLGFGIEAQRHFYKKVYLFAATELKGGYGNGLADTSVSQTFGHGTTASHFGENVGRRDANLLYVGLTASIGAKIQWSRICLGTELFPAQMAYTKVGDGSNRGGVMDLDIGTFSQRLFLHWLF